MWISIQSATLVCSLPSNVKKLRQRRRKVVEHEQKETPEFNSRDVLFCGNSSILSSAQTGEILVEGSRAGAAAQQYGERVSGLLSSVVNQTLLPAVSTVYSNISSSASLADAAAGKIGETLVGHSDQEFQDAVRAKMNLLNELSSVRAALGADEEVIQKLEGDVNSLRKEREEAIKARAIFEEALETSQKEEKRLQATINKTSEELCVVQKKSLEASTNVSKLEAQNELLRAQANQLRGHFDSRERSIKEQLMACQSQLNDRVQSIAVLEAEIRGYEETLSTRNEEVTTISNDLQEARDAVHLFEEELHQKEETLNGANRSIAELKDQIVALEQSLVDIQREKEEDIAKLRAEQEATSEMMQGELERIEAEAKGNIQQVEAELEKVASEKTLLKKDIARINEDLESSRREAETFRSELEAKTGEIDQLKQSMTGGIETMQRQADEAAKEWKQKEEELKAQLEEQFNFAARADAEFKERAAAFEADLREAASTRSSLEDKIQRLTDDFAESQDCLDDCQRQIEKKSKEMAEMQSKMSEQVAKLKQQAEEDTAMTWSNKEAQWTKQIQKQKDLVIEAEEVSKSKEEYYEKAMRKLHTRLDAKKEIVNKLNQKHAASLAQLESNIFQLKEEIAQKESYIAEVEGERKGDTTSLQAEIDSMIQNKENTELEMQTLLDKCRTLEKSTEEMQQKVEMLQSERDMIETEKISLQGKLAMETQAFLRAKGEQKEALRRARDESAETRAAFEKKVDLLIEEVERVTQMTSSEHAKLEARNEELNECLAQRDDEFLLLQDQISIAEKRSVEEQARQSSHIHNLGQELDTVRKELKRAEENARSSEDKVNESLAIVQAKEQALCIALLRLSKTKDEFNETLSQRDTQIEGLRKELFAARSQMDSIEIDKNEAAMAAESNVSHLVEVAEKADLRATGALEALVCRNNVLKSVKESLLVACQELEINYQSFSEGKDLTDDELLETIELLSQRASNALVLAESRGEDITKVTNELSQLREALNTTAESLAQSEASQEDWKSKALVAQREVSSLQEKVEALETDISVSNETNEALSHNMEELHSLLEQVKSSRDRLNKALCNESEEKQVLAEQVGFLEQKLSRKVEECDQLETSVNDLKVKYLDSQSKDKELLASKDQRLNQLQEKTASLESTNKELEEENKDTAFSLQVAETRLSKSQETIGILESDKAELEARLLSKSSEVEEVSAKLEAQSSILETATEESKLCKDAYNVASNDLDSLRSLLVGDSDGDNDISKGKEELSKTALHIYEQIETLKKENELLQQKSKSQPSLSTPTCQRAHRPPTSATPSKMLSPILSPSLSTDIVSKHDDMLEELRKMKEAIGLAIMSPFPNTSVDTNESTPKPSAKSETRDEVLSAMESQVGALVADLTSAKAALDEKEDLIKDIAVAVGDIEEEREEMQYKIDTMQTYTAKMEEQLARELEWRRKAEAELKSLRQRTPNSTRSQKQRKADRLRRAVSQEVALQLEATREKLVLLKTTLREGGSLVDHEDQQSPGVKSENSLDFDLSASVDDESMHI